MSFEEEQKYYKLLSRQQKDVFVKKKAAEMFKKEFGLSQPFMDALVEGRRQMEEPLWKKLLRVFR